MLCSNQGARNQFIRKTRFGGDDQDDLCRIGGDEFLLPLVTAIQQRATWRMAENLCLAVVEWAEHDAIAAGIGAFLATRNAIDAATVRVIIQHNLVVSAERGDNSAEGASGASGASGADGASGVGVLCCHAATARKCAMR